MKDLIPLTNPKVGDLVFSFCWGNGVIYDVNSMQGVVYPILVQYDCENREGKYNMDGKDFHPAIVPILFNGRLEDYLVLVDGKFEVVADTTATTSKPTSLEPAINPKVDDMVFSLEYGHGLVTSTTSTDIDVYPIEVMFENHGCRLYSREGFYNIDDSQATLFKDNELLNKKH